MKFRHEWKHRITYADMLILRARLLTVTKTDPYAIDGKYFIRSLYFDTPEDKALREKLDGVNKREKFRLRYYNNNTELIHLEKKSKINGLCLKQKTPLSANEAKAIINGNIDWLGKSQDKLLAELFAKLKGERLKPKTIIDYTREPFVFAPGNVRITIDYNIKTGLGATDFLNPDCPTVPIANSPIILEVKWDEFLPDIIRRTVRLDNCRMQAYSKYAAGRIYD